MKSFLVVFIAGVVFLSCAPQSRKIENTLVDIDGLIDKQLEELQQRRPTLTKRASVDALVSDSSWTPAAATWQKELEIFRALGMINQRIYKGAYTKQGPIDDPKSNLLISSYTSANASVPLRWLHLYYQDESPTIRQVEGAFEEITPLFLAHRRLSIWFEDDRGRPVLSRYEIVGYQKSALRDTVHFRIQSEVGW